MAICRSCRAPIFWAVARKANGDIGSPMPVDTEPNAAGNLEIVDRTRRLGDDDWTPVVRVLRKGEGDTLPGLPTPDRFVAHFATCPNAARHRKGGAAA